MWIGLRYPKITQAEYNDFHSVDRELYATLVYDLWRDPIEAIQMMAIWIWLERVVRGSPALTRMLLTFSSQWNIDRIGDEALLCWACFDNPSLLYSSSAMDFPLTNKLLKKEMPMDFFRKNHEASIAGINEVIKTVCVTCLKDIWDGAIARNAHVEFLQCMTTTNHGQKTTKTQPDERTLFVTFSRGHPVSEWEVREFLTQIFGDCIEAFYMQEVAKGEHALFAKIVLYHTSYMNVVLRGGTTAKFTINRKPLWIRKFIPKRGRG